MFLFFNSSLLLLLIYLFVVDFVFLEFQYCCKLVAILCTVFFRYGCYYSFIAVTDLQMDKMNLN